MIMELKTKMVDQCYILPDGHEAHSPLCLFKRNQHGKPFDFRLLSALRFCDDKICFVTKFIHFVLASFKDCSITLEDENFI